MTIGEMITALGVGGVAVQRARIGAGLSPRRAGQTECSRRYSRGCERFEAVFARMRDMYATRPRV
jgi:hypothetical protein